MPCKISAGNVCGLETVTLENEIVRALIIAGKGADLLEFEWKPTGTNCLYRSDTPFEDFQGHDLSKQRLHSHCDKGLGGWMTVLPHRAKYKDIELTQETGGLAATVPWAYRIIKNEENAVSATFFTDLPLIPMQIAKTFSLFDGSAGITIEEKVSFNGDEPVVFTWTEHALFGGSFVDADTVVQLPSHSAFDVWAHMASPDMEPACFEHPANAFPLKGGIFDLCHPLPPAYNGSEFFVFRDLKEGKAGLYNVKSGLSVSIEWDEKRFPFMRSLYQADGLCVVGLEPGNDAFSGLEHSLKYGTYTKMLPGEEISTQFKLSYRSDGTNPTSSKRF